MAEEVTACGHCDDTGWICEEHPDQAWPHEDCDGAGMPCPVCNGGSGRSPDKPLDISRLGFAPEVVGAGVRLRVKRRA